jgi:hypothetical protein
MRGRENLAMLNLMLAALRQVPKKLVCKVHDYLVPVWPPMTNYGEYPDMMCKECIATLWSRGDISQGSRVQYLY